MSRMYVAMCMHGFASQRKIKKHFCIIYFSCVVQSGLCAQGRIAHPENVEFLDILEML